MSIDERKQVVQLDKKRTLIDINKDETNFEAEIIVLGKDFDLVIVSQTELDNSSNFNYQKITNNFRQQIKVNDNVYQNYYLMMKSDAPQSVNLMIRLKPLPKNAPEQQPQPVPQQMPPQQMPPQQPFQDQPQQMPPQQMSTNNLIYPDQHIQPEYLVPKQNTPVWRYVAYGALALLVIYLLYSFVFSKKNKAEESKSTESVIPKRESMIDMPRRDMNFTNNSNENSESRFPKLDFGKNNSNIRSDSSDFSKNIRKYKFVY